MDGSNMGIAGIAQKQLLHKMKWVQIQKRYQPWFDTLAHHGTSAIAKSVLKFLHLLVSHGLTVLTSPIFAGPDLQQLARRL